MILTADIGGTKTVMAAASRKDNRIVLSSIKYYESKRYLSFEEILDDYLAGSKFKTEAYLCLAVAGPVVGGQANLTNLSMKIDGKALAKKGNVRRVELLNDLQASAYGLSSLPDDGMICIHKGDSVRGNQVLISPGTGLGESIVHAVDDRMVPVASEGGHTDFAPFDGVTGRLWSFVRRTSPRVSVESVLSGPGIYNIFRFLTAEEGREIDEDLARQLTSNPGLVITNRALEGKDRLLIRTIRLFLDILAAEAGNLALKAMSTGGIYIGGGIIPRILTLVDKSRFASILADKGRHQSLLETFPIYLVTETQLPLYGAAYYGFASSIS